MSPLEFRALQHDESRCLRLSVTAVQRGHGGSELVWGTVRDVTEQRQTEREIRARIAVSDATAAPDRASAVAHGLRRGLIQ